MSVSRRKLARATLACLAGGAAVATARAQPSSNPGSDVSLSQQRVSGAESFVPMPRMLVSLLGRYAPNGGMMVGMCLDVPDAALRTRAQRGMPRLRDAINQAASAYVQTHLRRGAAPNADQLARMMQAAVDGVLGQPGARLLLLDLIIQPRL